MKKLRKNRLKDTQNKKKNRKYKAVIAKKKRS